MLFQFIGKTLTIPPVFRQFISIICCDLLIFSAAATFAWPSINSNELQEKNTTFPTGALNFKEISYVISLANIGSIIGNFAVVPVAAFMGPKSTIHLFAIPIITSAILIIWAQDVYFLYVSRLLIGFVGGGLPVTVPLLINDICFDNIRGALNGILETLINFGFIVSFLLGKYLSISDQAKIYLIVPSIAAVLLFLLPESPIHLAKNGKEQEAKKSYKFYKGTEIEKPGNIELETISNVETANKDTVPKLKLSMNDFTTRQAKRAYFICFVAYTLSFLCGVNVMRDFVSEIFQQTDSVISIKSSSLVISTVAFVGNILCLIVIERFERKTLFIGSSIVTAAGYFSFGIYCYFWLHHSEFKWMPLLCFAWTVFFSSFGLMAIPYTLAAEIFPVKIRGVCISIALCLMWTTIFVYETIFPTFINSIGLSGCMILFGIMCLLCTIFGFFFVPNTRGKSHEEIMQILAK